MRGEGQVSEAHLRVRLTEQQMERLDALAGRMGVTRSQVIRRLLNDATEDLKATSRRLTEEEALDLLHEQARGGRVSAIVEVLRRERDEDPRQRAFMALEQLAAERRQ
jgi:antitoxin component of RelBE/YafQ-DinJ toxin-antitoxin module